jgi:hypothetical protein
VRWGRRFSQPGDPDHLKGNNANGIPQLHRDEVEGQHAHQRIEQGMKNSGWIAATPDGGKSEQAHKITDAPLKALDLVRGIFGLRFHN